MSTSSSSPASQPDQTSTQPSSSPFESPSMTTRCASPKTLYMVDITYPESYMRTPLPLLPFTAPKWLLDYGRGAGYIERGCVLELNDDEADIVRESIEPCEDITVRKEAWGHGKREWNGWATPTSSRKRRYDSSSSDITSVHPTQKLKRS